MMIYLISQSISPNESNKDNIVSEATSKGSSEYTNTVNSVQTSESQKVSINTNSNSTMNYIQLPDNVKIPVLMYHSISNDNKNNPVPVEVFESHMLFLKKNKWTTITTSDLLKFRKDKSLIPERPILFTFDDGYKNNYTEAYRILKKYELHGNFAIITNFVGQKDRVSWENLKEMSKNNQEIISHTVDHCYLTIDKVNYKNEKFRFQDSPIKMQDSRGCVRPTGWEHINTAQIRNELYLSKKKLELELGINVNTIIYPYGKYNKQILDIAKEIGYDIGFTTMPQHDFMINLNSLLDIPRLGVYGSGKLPL